MELGAVSEIKGELTNLLEIKKRLLRTSLDDGSILQRDDPEFLESFRKADSLIDKCLDRKLRERAQRILSHIRQFNPFNSSDVDENERISEVIEDFESFLEIRIEQLSEV